MAFKISLGNLSVTFNADTKGWKKGKREVNRDLSDIDKKLSKSAKSFNGWSSNVANAATRAGEVFKAKSKGFDAALDQTANKSTKATTAVKEVSQTVGKLSTAASNAANKANDFNFALSKTAQAVNQATDSLSKQVTQSKKASDAAAKLGESTKKIGDSANKAAKESDNLATTTDKTKKGYDAASKSAKRYKANIDDANKSIKSLGKGALDLNANLTRVAAAVGAAIAAGKITEWSDAFISAQNQIRLTTNSTEELAQVTDQLFAVAARSRSEVGATADLYRQLNMATKDMNLSTADQLRLTETIGKTFSLAGGNAQTAAGAIRQLGQALAAGALRGDEFNSIAEQAPFIMQALRKELGMTQGELREFAATGGISAEIMVNALTKAADSIDNAFAKSMKTFSQQATVANNNVIKFVGESKELNAVMSLAGAGLVKLSENLDLFVDVLQVAAILIGSKLVAAIATATAAYAAKAIATAKATAALIAQTAAANGATTATTALGFATKKASAAMALLGGPIGAIIAVIGTATFAFSKLNEELKSGKDRIDEYRSSVEKLTEAQKQAESQKLAERAAELKKEIAALEPQVKRASSSMGGLGVAGINAQARLNKLKNELKQTTDRLYAIETPLESIKDRLADFGTNALNAAMQSSPLLQLITKGVNRFDEFKEAIKGSADAFEGMTKAQKAAALDEVNAQIDATKQKILELRDAIPLGGLFGGTLDEDSKKLAELNAQLSALEQKQKDIKNVDTTKADKEAQRQDEFKAFLQMEKNKTKALQMENALRAGLDAVEQQNKITMYDNELAARKKANDTKLAQDLLLIEHQRELAQMKLEEDIAQIRLAEEMKDDEKKAVIKERREQYKAELEAFKAEEGEIIDKHAKIHANIEEEQWKFVKAKAKEAFEDVLGVVAMGSEKARKIQKQYALANAGTAGYEAAVNAWNAGMSTGGPWAPLVAASYTASSLAKTAGLIQRIRSSGKGASGQTRAVGGSGVPATPSGGSGQQQGQAQGESTNRNVTVNFAGGDFLMNQQQVRTLIGQIDEALGDGVSLNLGG